MRVKLKALCELQEIDLELAKAEKAKASLDDGSDKKRQVEVLRQEAQRADKVFHETSAELHDKELTLEGVETKQKTFRDKLYGGSVTNPKELESMGKEIEMLGRQKDKLEEGILELLDIVEEHKSTLAAAQAALKQQEEELAAYLEKLKQDEASLTARIQELSTRRVKALAAVDPALLKRYESMRDRAGGVVVSRVEGESCVACHTQIMTFTMRELQADKAVETCENCGRLLYLEE